MLTNRILEAILLLVLAYAYWAGQIELRGGWTKDYRWTFHRKRKGTP